MAIDPNGGPHPDPGGLQFERAEFTGGASGPECSSCKQPASPEYFQFGGRVFCPTCRFAIGDSFDKLEGSGNLGLAAIYGFGAAVAGSLIFYAVSALTGYEFGLIAVVVGVLVGKAVRRGSGSIGGRKYQVLAMLLTYLSIASTSVPAITRSFYARAEKQEKLEAARGSKVAPPSAAPDAAPSQVVHIGALRFYLLVLGLALVLPFLGGFSNILGLIIIGIGLWEAWKYNRRLDVQFTGPFNIAAPPPAGTS